MTDIEAVTASWQRVSKFGDRFPLRFYTKLRLAHPKLMDLFDVYEMNEQRDKLMSMLAFLVNGEATAEDVRDLGRRHVGYGVQKEHYPLVGGALIATLRHFETDEWTPGLEAAWAEVYKTVVNDMTTQGALNGPN